jgi:hypothetical protein
MSTATVPDPRWSDAQLDAMRNLQDPPADSVVAGLFAAGEVDAVNTLMATLGANDDPPPGSLPASVRDYLTANSRLPDWADPAKIQAGERVFWRYGPAVLANLHCYSLPFCYAGRKGVQVLALTSRLYSNPTRRIVETAQMVVDVMRPGGLGALGTGVRTALRVRMMHAGVRFQIGHYPGWNPEFDLPINQEDMAGTILSFSYNVLDGLGRLGFALSADEVDAYLHCWNVVGELIGIRPEMLAHRYDDARTLAARIAARQFAACAEGQLMARALVEMMQHELPGNLFDPVPAMLIRYLLGDHGADILGVAAGHLDEVLVGPLRLVAHLDSALDQQSNVIARIHEAFSRALIQGIMLVERQGKAIPFRIPTELLETWGVNWQP